MLFEKLSFLSYPTFRGGIHLADNKWTKTKKIEVMPPPNRIYVHFSQHTGLSATPLKQKGDDVKIGTKIGEAQGFISSPVHASISGRVVGLKSYPHPKSGVSLACIIDNDFKNEWENSLPRFGEWTDIAADDLLSNVREAGITGQGGASFPTHVKLSPPKEKPIDTLIINGCECEPMVTSDYRLMLEHANDIIEGAQIMQKILGAHNLIFALEGNKKDAARHINEHIKNASFAVKLLKTKYPQGAEQQLIKSLLARRVPSGGLPMDIGCVVHNVGTALAVQQAVKFGKPLIERVITVTGQNVREPKNVLVPLGTPAIDVINFCGGYISQPAKIILGGPLMGLAQYSEHIPIIKGTTAILVMSDKELVVKEEGPCVRCARCVDVCPMNLLPCDITLYIENKKLDKAHDYGIFDCIECGCCAYTCPTGRKLVHHIQFGKRELTVKDRRR